MAHDHHPTPTEKRSRTALGSAFWFILILALLFIAAVNFVNVMGSNSHEAGHGGHGADNSGVHAPTQPTMEATTQEQLPGETGIGRPQADTTQHHGASDSGVNQGAAH